MPELALKLPEQFVLMDTEYTTWPGARERNWSGPNEYREIVQIGAIVIEGSHLREIAAFEALVQPVKNPILSPLFTELTGITQDMLTERGTSLESATNVFVRFMGDLPCFTYGIDGTIIDANFKLLKQDCPFELDRCENIRLRVYPILEKLSIDPKGYSSGTLISAFRPEDEHLRAHDAINDMRNLREALVELRKKGF